MAKLLGVTVPLVTVMLPGPNPLTSSENVAVTLMGDDDATSSDAAAMLTVGLWLSKVKVYPAVEVLPLPALSCTLPLPIVTATLTFNTGSPTGETSNVYTSGLQLPGSYPPCRGSR